MKSRLIYIHKECDVMPGEALIVTAFAGAGKTSSLVEYARR